MIIFYDAKLFNQLSNRICDENIIEIFNQYQYVSADERLLAKEIEDFNHLVSNEKLNSKREQFHKMQKTSIIDDGVGLLLQQNQEAYRIIIIFQFCVYLKR